MPETHHPLGNSERARHKRKRNPAEPAPDGEPKPPLPAASPAASDTRPVPRRAGRTRIRIGLGVTLLGILLYVLGVAPALFSLDRSPVTGFIQIAVFLVGLAFICLGGYTCMNALWIGREMTIQADIGLRLVSTGYVISVASGMADVFGFGAHALPSLPYYRYFGPYQAIGVIIGELVIALGFVLLIPFPPRRRKRRR